MRKFVSHLLSCIEYAALALVLLALLPVTLPLALILGIRMLWRRAVIWSRYGGDIRAYERDRWKDR